MQESYKDFVWATQLYCILLIATLKKKKLTSCED